MVWIKCVDERAVAAERIAGVLTPLISGFLGCGVHGSALVVGVNVDNSSPWSSECLAFYVTSENQSQVQGCIRQIDRVFRCVKYIRSDILIFRVNSSDFESILVNSARQAFATHLPISKIVAALREQNRMLVL